MKTNFYSFIIVLLVCSLSTGWGMTESSTQVKRNNIFTEKMPADLKDQEWFTTLVKQKNVEIERIISTGQTTPVDEPYDQDHDEFVIIMQGRAKLWLQGQEEFVLNSGDYVFIPAGVKHRVTYTSEDPPAIWLAVHIY